MHVTQVKRHDESDKIKQLVRFVQQFGFISRAQYNPKRTEPSSPTEVCMFWVVCNIGYIILIFDINLANGGRKRQLHGRLARYGIVLQLLCELDDGLGIAARRFVVAVTSALLGLLAGCRDGTSDCDYSLAVLRL